MLLNLLGQNASVLGRVRYFIWIRHHSLALRAFLIATCLGLTFVSALLLDQNITLGVLPFVAIVVIGGFLFIYYQLEATLLIILAVTMLLHEGVGTGTGTKITFTFALLALAGVIWVFRMVMVEKSLALRSSPANLPALLFIVVVIISTIWSDVFVESSVRFMFNDKPLPRLMSAIVLILSSLAYYLYANHIRSLRSIRIFIWWFIFIGGLFMMFDIFNMPFPPIFNISGQFATWVAVFAVGQLFFNKIHKPYLRVILIVITLGWVYITAGLGLSWLSGWLPLAVALLVLLFFRSRRLFFVALLIGLVLGASKLEGIVGALDVESAESGETRVEAWGRTLDLTADHFFFGTGPAGYHLYFSTYLVGFFQLSHNNYIDIIAQTGIVGFLIYMWFWIAIGVMAVRTYRAAPRGGFQHAAAASLLAAYVATMTVMMLGDWVTPFAYTQTLAGIDYTIWSWMLAGLTVALYYEIQTSQKDTQEHPSGVAVQMNLSHENS
jgi:O-antigen ligase